MGGDGHDHVGTVEHLGGTEAAVQLQGTIHDAGDHHRIRAVLEGPAKVRGCPHGPRGNPGPEEADMGAHEQLDLWNINEEPATRLVTVTEAGRMLSVSRSTVYELIGAGRLEVVHIGRSVRVPLDAIASYIKTLRRPVLRPVDGAPADAPA